jgi:hypothetical protein
MQVGRGRKSPGESWGSIPFPPAKPGGEYLSWPRIFPEASLIPGVSIARVAREHGVNANQLFQWRYDYRKGNLGGGQAVLLAVRCASGKTVRCSTRVKGAADHTLPVSAPHCFRAKLFAPIRSYRTFARTVPGGAHATSNWRTGSYRRRYGGLLRLF